MDSTDTGSLYCIRHGLAATVKWNPARVQGSLEFRRGMAGQIRGSDSDWIGRDSIRHSAGSVGQRLPLRNENLDDLLGIVVARLYDARRRRRWSVFGTIRPAIEEVVLPGVGAVAERQGLCLRVRGSR